MAELVMAAATPHNPLFWRTMVEPMPDDLAGVRANFTTISETIQELEVDAIVVVGTDHIRQFYSDNSPAFIVGMADSYHGTFENEVRTFGMPYCEVKGHRGLAEAIAGHTVMPDNFDFAVSSEWRLDHSFILPLLYLTPEMDIPILPIHCNTALPPLPQPQRFAALGEHIRDSVERMPGDERVALITSGHMANDIGGPKQFLGGGSPDQVFDDEAVRWMAEGDLQGAIDGCTYDRIMAAGNITYQYINILSALAAMDSRPAELAEATQSRFSSGPFFMWRKP